MRSESNSAQPDYHRRALAGVLFLGGMIGITDFLWLDGFPPRSQLAFGVGWILLALVPYLAWTRHIRSTMLMAIFAASTVFLGNFFLYGSAYYLAAGFSVPLAAAMFMRSVDALATLIGYCLAGVLIGTSINTGIWTPPFELNYKFQLVINGLLIIAAMSLTTIWRERQLAAAKRQELEQKERLETIFLNGYGLMVEADHRQIIRSVTGQLLADLGYSRDDLVGRHQATLLAPSQRQLFDVAQAGTAQADPRAQDPIRHDEEVRILNSQGQERWVRLSGGTIGFGADRKWVLAMQDIHEAVTQRNRVFEIARLESLGEVCGGLAHDFNNLLTVIGINAEFIEDDRIRSEIISARDQAVDLTAGLLTFARKQEFREHDIDLRDFLTNIQPLVERIAGPKIHCRWDITDESHCIRIDPAQLQQVIINLVTNSMHAMPDGGKLKIQCEQSVVLPDHVCDQQRRPESGFAVLTITDDGTGMDEETRSRSVEPFFTTKPRGKGTGLGLATAHGAVRSAGGFLYVDSKPDKGTSVSIYLPLIKESQPTPWVSDFPASTEAFCADCSLLIVEDRAEVCTTLETLLGSYGFQVFSKRDAESAMTFLENSSVDLVISDVMLPGASGVDLAGWILDSFRNIPIILISGHQNQDLAIVEQFPDSLRFIPKPFSTSKLLGAIRQLTSAKIESPSFDLRRAPSTRE